MKTRREFLRSTMLGASAAWTVPMFVERTFGQLHAESKDLAIQRSPGRTTPSSSCSNSRVATTD